MHEPFIVCRLAQSLTRHDEAKALPPAPPQFICLSSTYPREMALRWWWWGREDEDDTVYEDETTQ